MEVGSQRAGWVGDHQVEVEVVVNETEEEKAARAEMAKQESLANAAKAKTEEVPSSLACSLPGVCAAGCGCR